MRNDRKIAKVHVLEHQKEQESKGHMLKEINIVVEKFRRINIFYE